MITILIFLCFSWGEDNKYLTAYHYVRHDSLASKFLLGQTLSTDSSAIQVSDSIVYIDALFFLDELIAIRHGQIRDVNRLRQIKQETYVKEFEYRKAFKGYRSKELKTLNTLGPKRLVLYFSEVRDDILLGELFRYSGQKSLHELRTFNESVQYLFHFGEGGKIEHVFSKKMAYN